MVTTARRAQGESLPEAGSPASAAVLARLASLAPNLREAERKIAEYVLANPGEVVYLSVTELADRTETSEATVIRFAQRLGYAGYAALKIALALELRTGASGTGAPVGGASAPSELDGGSDVASIKRRVIQLAVDRLHDTIQLLDDDALQQAVTALTQARRIEVYGVGGSAVVAQEAYFALMRLGLPVVAVTDPHLQVMSAVQLQAQDVALAVSQSGSSRDTVEALRLAREAGATCICLTHHARSPITQVAHVTLLAAVRVATPHGLPGPNRVSQVAVIEVLAAAVSLARGQASARVLAQGRQAVSVTKRF
ncbi:MAG TPA: MurR/RpiR family transcriptional regulator [Chloroflexota bacterium]|nr:MurR/RpiR family transcriptional regulator [Chloroflexota bacterium]